MSEQLSFILPIKVARERDAFFVSEANQQAVAQLENTAQDFQGGHAARRIKLKTAHAGT